MSVAAIGVVASYAVDVLELRAEPAERRQSWLSRARPVALLALAFGLGAWMLHASPSPAIDVWTVHQQGADTNPPRPPGLRPRRDRHAGHVLARAGDRHLRVPSADPPAHGRGVRGHPGDALGATRRNLHRGRAPPRDGAATRLAAPGARFAHGVPALSPARPLRPRAGVGRAAGTSAARRLYARGVDRAARVAAVMLGLLCALKQHLVLYLPALALLPGIDAAGAAIAMGTLLATYAPFALTAPTGLWNAVVVHHLKNPFRADSLSLTARLWDAGILLPPWLGFAGALASLGALAWIPRRLGSLLLASSLTFLVFYLLGRQAFCNYYYLLGATWLFAAASLAEPAGAERTSAAAARKSTPTK